MKIHEVGSLVWVLSAHYGKSYKWGGRWTKPFQVRIKRQEWWENGCDFPLYYDVTYPNSNRVIGHYGSGNWYFDEIFDSEAECLKSRIEFLQDDVKFIMNFEKKKTLLDIKEMKFKRSQIAAFQRRLLEIEKDHK